jgi:hypothetical protein
LEENNPTNLLGAIMKEVLPEVLFVVIVLALAIAVDYYRSEAVRFAKGLERIVATRGVVGTAVTELQQMAEKSLKEQS